MENIQKQIVISAGLVLNQGNILLLKRLDSCKRAPGKWEVPSGRLLYGENPLDALPRIVKQLTGINVKAAKLVHSRSLISKRTKKHVIIFYNEAEIVDEKVELKPSDEFVAAEWVDITKLQQYDLETGTSEALRKYEINLLEDKQINKQADNITTENKLIIYTDGGSRGNPGPSASGFVIMNNDQEVIEEGGEYLGITTNNQAEYQAVKLALQRAKKYNAKKLDIRIDSLLVVNQMNGVYKIKSKDLWPIHEDIKKLIVGYEGVTFSHVYREDNKLADAKVNEVLDSRKD